MDGRIGLRRFAGLTAIAAVTALAIAGIALGVTGAVNTTDDPGLATADSGTLLGGPTAACLNGQPGHTDPATNCNIYQAKTDVFLSGSPIQAALGTGTYFFAVMVPGGQPDPNDGSAKNLSSPDDAWTNREFTVDSSGNIAPANGSTHAYDATRKLIQVAPYEDTTNPGGVYILAVCKVPDSPGTSPAPGVNARDCKYDAFKVKESETPGASGPTILKDASGAYDNTYTWDIEKSVDKTLVQQTGGTASFTYTVHVTHDAGSISNVTVSGTITVFNPNSGSMIADVTDALSDATPCSVTGGNDATLASGDNTFAYSCGLGSSVPTSIDNTATVTWDAQTVDPDGSLAAGSADFTFSSVSFTANNVDNCTTVTDPIPGGGTSNDNPFPKTVCVGDSGDGGAGTGSTAGFTFTYHVSYNVGVGCADYTNTATESTDGNDSSVTVRVCGPANNSALTIGFWKGPNGNSLIQNYCSWNTPTLATYLSTLGAGAGPFTDAAGKSCSQLVTYVNGIIKNANATNMNTMLKAQMLATALDVYFSGTGYRTTSLGGAKPPSNFLTHGPLGGFNMDLTAICPMVDNTTAGTATCKNNTPSTNGVTSGAFPSSPHTVQWILDFAATLGSSPWTTGAYSGSNVWYAGNRTLEEILKNTFDQINNNDAFAG